VELLIDAAADAGDSSTGGDGDEQLLDAPD
jgi:hypothetical protein